MFNGWRLFDLLLRRPSLVREVKRRDRVSYPPSSPLRRYRKGVLVVRLRPDPIVTQARRQIASGETEPGGFDCEPEVERGIQRALDRIFGPDSAPGPGDSDE